MKAQTKTVAIINQSKILVIENGEKFVPIKPICEALGVQYPSQKEKIESDEILSSTVRLSRTVAADGKEREMFCLPFKYVFGWLFTINPSNVKEEAREAVIRYKLACYDALYQSFTDSQEFLDHKQQLIEAKHKELEEITTNFKSAKNLMYEKKRELRTVLNMTLDQWIANNRQLGLFDQGEEGEDA